MRLRTYADGLREAARQCEAEILPPHKDPPPDEQGQIVRQTCEAAMRIMAVRLRRLADEAATE